jgi:hypothetical protein
MVPVDSHLNSEHIDTLLISVGVRKGGLGGGWSFWTGAQNIHVTVKDLI